MGDRTFPHIGDDLHVVVRVRGEALVRGDLVVVPDAQGTDAHALRIVIIREGEVVPGFQPAMVGAA
jgi:hypothetical protein